MKKLIIAFVLSSIAPITMTARDVLYLKNGSVIKGEIIELNMGGNVKIQTSDGSLFVYESNQVEKIGKEQTESQAPVKPSVEQPKTAELKTELKAEEKSADRHFRHKGYRGFADFGGLLGLNRAFDFDFYSALMFSTSQGFQICPWVFIGAGVGVNIYNYSYSNTDCFGNGDCEYSGTDVFVPFFADLRIYPIGKKRVTPFLGMKLGYSVIGSMDRGELSERMSGAVSGFYHQYTAGVSVAIKQNFGLYFSMGYSGQHLSDSNEKLKCFSIQTGLDW